jgi:putative transcriptional regulator
MISRRTLLAAAVMPVRAEEIAAGRFLIATVKSRDPELAKSVILLIQYDQRGAIGLIVNHPTGVPLSRLFPASKMRAFVYAGGPVPLGSNALLRSERKLKSATNLFDNVYLIADEVFIEATANAGAPSNRFRVYAGYSGWSAAQLRNEVATGLWRVAPADAAIVFDPHPETVWQRLSRK